MRRALRTVLAVAVWVPVAIADRIRGLVAPARLEDALSWARRERRPPLPTATTPATVRQPSNPFAPTADPCFDCGDAKDDHRDGRCIGDFFHCSCKEWKAGDGRG